MIVKYMYIKKQSVTNLCQSEKIVVVVWIVMSFRMEHEAMEYNSVSFIEVNSAQTLIIEGV